MVTLELAVILYGFRMLDAAGYPWVAPLEARPLVPSTSTRVRRADLVDQIHLLSGGPILGRDAEADPAARLPSFRKQLVHDSGHFSWIVLDDVVTSRDLLHTLALSGLSSSAQARRAASQGIEDGIVNVFYDLGGDERTWVHNWSTVGVQEMQIAPLLPWTKRLDVIVLSAYDPDHCGALSYILRAFPDVLIVGPPIPKKADSRWGGEGEEILTVARGARRLRPLPIGLHRLTSRLSVLVSPTVDGPPEAALVIATDRGRVVVAGAGGRSAVERVAALKAAAPGEVTVFIGATGLADDEEIARTDIARLQRAQAGIRVVAGASTSLETLSLLREVLGAAAVKAARLGSRIPLSGF